MAHPHHPPSLGAPRLPTTLLTFAPSDMGLRNWKRDRSDETWIPHRGPFKVTKLPTSGPGSGIEDHMTQEQFDSGRVIRRASDNWV